MALPSGQPLSLSFLRLLLFISSISVAAAGIVGVDYGRDGDGILPPERVVDLLKSNGIGAARIYDTDAGVLRAFKDSGIKLVVALPNEKLADAARDPNIAGTWVWENIKAYYPATQIQAITVGNEVFTHRSDLTSSLVPAMWNVYNALKNLRLADAIKVTTPVAFNALDRSFPPSKGSFRGDLQPSFRQLLDFLDRTGSYFMVNLYPYIAYRDNYPNIDLDYALGLPNNKGVQDPDTKLMYYSLLDAERDAVYSAVKALGFGGTAATDQYPNSTLAASLRTVATGGSVGEIGMPTRGGTPPRRPPKAKLRTTGGMLNASLASRVSDGPVETVENAQAFNSNLVQRVLSGKTGTPLQPDADMDVYIFSLFNENRKPGPETERNFGLFYPDGRKVYDVPFRLGGDSWCVADPAVGNQRMQEALNWACAQGGTDCGSIQPGARCFEPNTVEAHASWAMNSYYQKHGRGGGTCDFNGAGRVVYGRPKIGNCDFPSSR